MCKSQKYFLSKLFAYMVNYCKHTQFVLQVYKCIRYLFEPHKLQNKKNQASISLYIL